MGNDVEILTAAVLAMQKQVENLILQNQELLRWKNEMNGIVNVLPQAFENINGAIEINKDAINECARNIYIVEKYVEKGIDNRDYEVYDPRRQTEMNSYFYPQILSVDAAIDQIVGNGKSLARFGDGEFSLMEGKQRWDFQAMDDRLRKRLIEVIESSSDQLLIGIANNYGTLSQYDLAGAMAIRAYMTPETRKMHRKYLKEDRIYYDAYITRPYVMYADKESDAPGKRFERLKTIWKNRNVIIVEGAHTCFGAGNDFLAETASIRRILAPATSSFSRYDELLAEAVRIAEKGDLCLLALGPCAGVMAYDLCMDGIQAIDVGHADLEYEWFLAGEGRRVPISYKFSIEDGNGDKVEEYHEPLYEKQIVARFE